MNCLSTLALGNSEKIGKVLEKLESNKVELSAIENNLTLLIHADPKEIDGIVTTLRQLGMSVEDNISIMSYTTSARLNEIVSVLKNNGIKEEVIRQELKGIVIDTKLGTEIEDLFNDDKVPESSRSHLRNIKKYMRLTGMMGKRYSKETLEAFCSRKHINLREFIGGMLSPSEEFVEIYYDKIMNGGELYIGPHKPIDSKFLEEHSEEILELSRIAAIKFIKLIAGHNIEALKIRGNRMGLNIDELQSIALEIIVSKCGNMVENLGENHNALRGSIVNMASKNLYRKAERCGVSTVVIHNTKGGDTYEELQEFAGDTDIYEQYEQANLREFVDYEQAEFNAEEEMIMECMISLIEERRSGRIKSKNSTKSCYGRRGRYNNYS